MIIKVTNKHIKKYKRRNLSCTKCPVALAVAERIGGVTWVSDRCISLDLGHTIKHIKAPRSVTRFVKSHDAGRPIRPFNFKLDYDPQ